MRRLTLPFAIAFALAACFDPASQQPSSVPGTDASVASTAVAAGPFEAPWTTPFGAIPFKSIQASHLPASLDKAMSDQLQAIAAITANAEPASIDNTMVPLERSFEPLRRVMSVYGVFISNLSNDEVRKIESEFAPKLAAHQNAVLLNAKLFERIKALDAQKDSLDAESARLVDQTLARMVRAGAALDETTRAQVAALTEQEAKLQTQFNQNLLKDTEAFVLELEETDLDGIPQGIRLSAGQTAADRGKPGKFVFTLQRPDYEAFMTYSTRRDLRERFFNAFIKRGNNGNEFDNNAIVRDLVKLRAERAELLGFANHAELTTFDSMAKTADAALQLMERVWAPALAQAKLDRDALQQLMNAEGIEGPLQGWDWRYYAERVRNERFALDPAVVAPYFGLDNMLQAAFAVSNRLFGVRFEERDDIEVYHEDVRAFEVFDAAGQHVGLFYFDPFARQGKRSGAWMANYRPQNNLDGDVRPQVVNNLNIAKPPAGKPALISVTEAITLFHELGHGLHGLLSNVKYPSLSGTAVPRDYVEFPAQFMEHYVLQPQVLREFAKHVETGEAMPDELIEKINQAETFNQGFATVEFLASALVDHRFHRLGAAEAANVDPQAFERDALTAIGALPEIPMRHRTSHFSHVFGGGYSAAYYAYMWSEVLDSDGFAAMEETGDIFHPEVAKRLKDWVYTRGNTIDWSEGYRGFRGKDPTVDALLRNRGLIDDSTGS